MMRRREEEDTSEFDGASEQSKWVIRVVTMGIVSALAFFAIADRNNIERRMTAVEGLSIATAQMQAANIAKSDARWEEIQRTLQDIETEVIAIRELKATAARAMGKDSTAKDVNGK